LEKKYRNRLILLREWRSIVHNVAKIVKQLYPEAEIYLIGGVAENRITVYSDVDIAIVFKAELNKDKRINILTHIWESIDDVIPMYYPLEIHILSINEFTRIKGKKIKLL